MKITALTVEGFGVWSGLRLDGLAEGLNAFYGPNEAGKTTLMQFVRSVLYGFSPQRRRYLPPLHGGRPGGSLQVESQSGCFLISRHDEGEQGAGGAGGSGKVVLEAADGTRAGEHVLPAILSNVDEAIFNNVFAIGLRELQELAVLSDTEAASLLYSLSAGLDRVSLVEVMRELGNSRARVLSPEGQPCQVSELLARREQIRSEIEELGRSTRQYSRLVADRGQIEREAARLEEQQGKLQYELRVIEIALAVRDRWQQRAELEAELAALAPAASMPEGAVQRLDAANARLRRHQQGAEQLRDQRRQLRREAAELKINEPLWRQAARVEALCEQAPWIGTLEEQILELETEIEELRPKVDAEQKRLGLGTPGEVARLPSMSSRLLAALRQPAAAMRKCRRRAQEARQQAGAAEETALALAEQLETALAARGQQDLAEAIQRTGGQMGQLRRWVQVDQRLDQMNRYRAELEEQSHALIGRQVLPVWVLVGLGGVFVLGVVLLMAGWFLPAAATGSVGLPLSLLGVAGIGAAVAAKLLLERSNARQLEACQKQIGLLNLQIKQAKEERESLDGQLPPGGGPIVSRLQAAERELAALEELTPLDTRRQAAQQEAEAAAARTTQAEQELAAARGRWRDALAAVGLPPTLAPKQVRTLMEGADRINELVRALQRRRDELAQRRRELDSFASRISQLAAEAGVDVAGCHPAEQLRRLGEELARQEDRFQRRDALRDRAGKLRRKQARHEAAAGRWKGRLHELLREAGVQDEEEFRHRAVQHARAQVLADRRAALEREIEAAIGGHCPEETIEEQLCDAAGDRIEARRQELVGQSEGIQAQLAQRFERRGRINEQLEALADDRRLPARQLELAVLEKRVEEAIRRWQVLAVTSRTLDSVRVAYERDRQPETLREASEYLQRLTQGRYNRVWTPLDEDVLRVDDADGRALPVELLSRGTREQLFLSLRLALAATYARRGVRLPLILDDVLVNFDGQRAKAAAAALRDFAGAGHQLLVFTCHEHILKLFKTLKLPVHRLPDCAEPDPSPLVITAAPQARRKPAVAAEAEPVYDPQQDTEESDSRAGVLPARIRPGDEEADEEAFEPFDDEDEPEDPDDLLEAADEELPYADEPDEDEDELEEEADEPDEEEEEEEDDFQWEEASDEECDDYEDYEAEDEGEDEDVGGAEAA